MNPLPPAKKEALQEQLKSFDPELVSHHLTRNDIDYFNRFTTDAISLHLNMIEALEKTGKVVVEVTDKEDEWEVTIVTYDAPGLLSSLTGVLTLMNVNILAGNSFTYTDCQSNETPSRLRSTFRRLVDGRAFFLEKGKVIDEFIVKQRTNYFTLKGFRERLQEELDYYLTLIAKNKAQEGRQELANRIAAFLSHQTVDADKRLLPIDIQIDSDSFYTILDIQAQDTPAFLYALSNTLALKKIKIHKLVVRTDGTTIHDKIYITDQYNRTISDKNSLEKLRAAIVITKQFMLLMPLAPSPGLAVKQFDQFIDKLFQETDPSKTLIDFENPHVLPSLAMVFGTGNYLWEEFVRMQYKSLLPLIQEMDTVIEGDYFEKAMKELKDRLHWAKEFDEKIALINEFKDRELFRLDLVYLIQSQRTFIGFSEDLNELAEFTLDRMVSVIYDNRIKRHGVPQFQGKPCQYVLAGLGKFGGKEMGYASDIEMVFIFEGSGKTDQKKEPIDNQSFFNLLVQDLKENLKVKSNGIFELDLRLRPYGAKGPLATSFSTWKEYYQNGTVSLDYERQSLIRLRPILGAKELQEKIRQVRDEILFSEKPLSIENTMALRYQQLKTLVRPNKQNAKFSKGGLVDLEYAVQFLQLHYGYKHQELRTGNTLEALQKLLELGYLTPTEFEKLNHGYAFLRRLINALRMVRGNAKDLEIPEQDSEEFVFLAKRLGYIRRDQREEHEQLQKDLEETFRHVSYFYRYKFVSPDSKESFPKGLPELLLEELEEEEKHKILKELEVQDVEKCYEALRNIVSNAKDKTMLISAVVLLASYLPKSPDPDKIILYFEKLLVSLHHETELFVQIIYNPRFLDILLVTFGYSDYLSNILIREPFQIYYLAKEGTLMQNKSRGYLKEELEEIIEGLESLDDKLNAIRRYQSMEILRIGIRDVTGAATFQRTVREISNLTDVVIEQVYLEVIRDHGYDLTAILKAQTVIALGKLGGRELNYSSDIDIVFVIQNELPETVEKKQLENVAQTLIKKLTESSQYGKLFRVDVRLRPYGRFGELVSAVKFYESYYDTKADGWEYQIWLKARVVTGDENLGVSLIKQLQGKMLYPQNRKKIFQSIEQLREQMMRNLQKDNILSTEVKLGPGGIRSIEFIIQRLQIVNGLHFPDIISGHSLYSLQKLENHKLISKEESHFLYYAYEFLRKTEHRIQLLGLQQLHVLPKEIKELDKLAKRMGFHATSGESAGQLFLKEYQKITAQVEQMSRSFSKQS